MTEGFVKYSFRPEEIDGGDNRLLPGVFESGSGMRRFAEPADRTMRAGFTHVEQGTGFETFFWYKEIWYVIRGSGDVTVLDKRTGRKIDDVVRPGDATYFPEGVRVELRAHDGEDLYFLYCAVPASIRDAQWLAAMDAQDLSDVTARGEASAP